MTVDGRRACLAKVLDPLTTPKKHMRRILKRYCFGSHHNGFSSSAVGPAGSCSRQAAGGVTLVEILIAISLFAVGIMAVVKMQTTAIQTNTFSNNMTQAVISEIQRTTEQLLALDYNDANLTPSTSYPAVTNGDFSTSWSVGAQTPIITIPVTVTTTWSDQCGNHSMSTTFIKSFFM